MKTIYFDMDGTLVNLYNVDNWLGQLTSENPSPYKIAEPLIDTVKLSELLIRLKDKGYKLGIITWSSKFSSEEFLEEVKIAKKDWISSNFPNIKFDEFVILDYSCNKASCVNDPLGILFDDDISVRMFWPGKSYPPEVIFEILYQLLEEEDKFNEGI